MHKYMIINYSDVTDEMIDACNKTLPSPVLRETLRHSITEPDRIILEWEGEKPFCLPECSVYSEDEIKEILSSEDWEDGN